MVKKLGFFFKCDINTEALSSVNLLSFSQSHAPTNTHTHSFLATEHVRTRTHTPTLFPLHRARTHAQPHTLYLLSLSGSPPLAKEEIQFNFKCDKNATDALQKKLQNEKSDPKLNGPQEIWGLISKHLFRKQRQLRRLLQNSDPFENLFRVKKFWFIGLL